MGPTGGRRRLFYFALAAADGELRSRCEGELRSYHAAKRVGYHLDGRPPRIPSEDQSRELLSTIKLDGAAEQTEASIVDETLKVMCDGGLRLLLVGSQRTPAPVRLLSPLRHQ